MKIGYQLPLSLFAPSWNRHTCTQTLAHHIFLLTLCLIVPPVRYFPANALLLCVRLTAETLSVAESPLLVFTVLSLCQSHPNGSDACRACPLCAYACLGFMSLHVHVCIECFPSRPRVTPCCDPASLPQWDASHCCCWLKTLCLCMRLCLCTLSA